MREYIPTTMSEIIEETFGEFDSEIYRIPSNIEHAAGYRRPIGDMQPVGDQTTIHQQLLVLSWYMEDED